MDPQQGPPQPDLLIGQTIGNYLVTLKLGEGGMGSVYLAEHPSIGKKVALKVLHSEYSTNEDIAARFFHEAKAVNDIGHPNIVDIVDFGILEAGYGRERLVYFIMEYLAGMTLSQLIRAEAPLPPERAFTIGLQVADALAASHRTNIVHRDLKPDNIILLQRGRERDFVKLLDFGIAKLTNSEAVGSRKTRAGMVMGTPAYMSPEQCEGRSSVDTGTDIYALGIVIYEMLTQRVPFMGEGYGEILVQHLTQRPRPISQFRMLAPHVEVVVLKALEKRVEMRYPRMEEFMRAMSDPVGYVEAHGGVGGFLQRQLMPSAAPVTTSLRLPSVTTPTPLPGTMVAPSGMSSLSPSSLSGMITPAPTTLSSVSGQMQAPRSKAGLIAAGLIVVGAAVAAIVAVAGKHEVAPVSPGAIASGESKPTSEPTNPSAVPSGALVDAAIDAAADPAADPAIAAPTIPDTPPPESQNTPQTGSDPVVATPPPEGDKPVEKPAGEARKSNVEIGVVSIPPGARVLIDGVDTGKLTPTTLNIPRGSPDIAISLRSKGYNTHTFKSVDTKRNSQQRVELVKSKSTTTPSPNPPVRGGSAAKAGSGVQPTQGSAVDPDDLMRP